MATIKLDTGSADITIDAPRYPEIPGETYPMLVGRTLGGGHKVADLGDGTEWEEVTLSFDRMSNADYVALRDFIQDDATWSTTLFTYTDAFSTNHTNMRYISGLPQFRSSVGNRWSGSIVISKDKSA
jgi:hypothetical protein